MIPWKHFIPVKEDLSDLSSKLDWAYSHEDECIKIAKNAQKFAFENLTKDKAILHLANTLVDFIKYD